MLASEKVDIVLIIDFWSWIMDGWVSTQLCLTLCNPIDCSLPGSSVHGIFQARILEWVAMPSSRGSSQPRDLTCISRISCISRWILCHLRRPWLKHMAKSCGEKGWERSMACFYFFVCIWLGANSFKPLFPLVCSLSHLPLFFSSILCAPGQGGPESRRRYKPLQEEWSGPSDCMWSQENATVFTVLFICLMVTYGLVTYVFISSPWSGSCFYAWLISAYASRLCPLRVGAPFLHSQSIVLN